VTRVTSGSDWACTLAAVWKAPVRTATADGFVGQMRCSNCNFDSFVFSLFSNFVEFVTTLRFFF